MAESLNRKACDRCHDQKLSCKRIGDGICDRCLRLNAECKSSPSLRYKKQILHYDQTQEQKPQQQHQQHQQQQAEQSQQLPQHHQSREVQQDQNPRPRVDYSQGPSTTSQNALNVGAHQQIGVQAGTERRSPKRRRTGSEAHLVQHDTGLPQLATDATNPGVQNHQMATPNGGAMGMAEYAMNLRNMDYMAGLAQPSMPQNHLLGAQIPPGVENYLPFHQVIPDLWPNQSQEQVQQLQYQQNHHHHRGHHHHHQEQPFLEQVSAAPLVVPDPAATQHSIFSSVPQPHQQQHLLLHHHHQRAAPILGSRRRQGPVPALSHPPPASATERRSRSNFVRINYTDLVPPDQDILSGPHIMDQFFQIYARVRVLSANLERLEQGKDYSDGPDGKPNEFTVAELYKHTHEAIDVLERVVAVRAAPNTTAADCPLDATDAGNSMFTLSLYARLLDLLQRVFALVRGLLAQADPQKDDTFASWLLPEMNIGAASIGAHPAFHMSLTVQLAMQFLSRFRDATVVLGLIDAAATNGAATTTTAQAGGPGGSSEAGLGLSYADIKNKEGNLSKLLGQLQDELNDFMDTMDAIDAKEEADKK
ncbi:hypothetical protein LLEC1_04312 [Akanthomyces lecanii]|uniref:Zn(2)-C6 fungal-type domain-containing protein n=1 Tax=Cordyceps confragosa TaxID=2714763 RepID=A0A179IB72_CORDF|nr:hypothetical protein LLEC1_04312 [Akanthomyces lecanii]